MNIKIIVATHKKYQMPKDDIYFPLHVGAEGGKNIGFIGDNTGDNISEKNPYFCELTGLYWAWKNLDYDYLGLVHYRRHFRGKTKNNNKFEQIIKKQEIENLLKRTDIIVPKKRYYFIETLYSHYEHTHYIDDLEKTKKILEQKYPDYVNSFNIVLNKKSAHMFNMFVMKKELVNNYCSFIFDILFELEKQTNPSQYNKYQARLYGYISELLLDVWIEQNKLKYKEIPVLNMEKINWFKKGSSFLKAKFFGKKYDRSF
ncbi:DUF4422 domain-containing protein [Candidatus Ruminimicrobium bovinum]|uniref:DUF4422 domain-containing protein n=1 Tax=Candidatus Ruminimicrobium bovinum TaxID=3242779 RepID=UPI0039B956FA